MYNRTLQIITGAIYGMLTTLPLILLKIHWLPTPWYELYPWYFLHVMFFAYYFGCLPVMNFPIFYFSHSLSFKDSMMISVILWAAIFSFVPRNFYKKISTDSLWRKIIILYTALCLAFSFATLFTPNPF